MRVLLMSPLPPPSGGIASWTKRYINSDIAKANEVDVVNIALRGKRLENFNAKMNIFGEFKRLYGIICDLKEKLSQKDYDIVHLNTSCMIGGLIRDIISAKIIKKSNTKLLVHFRCDITNAVSLSRFAPLLVKKLVKSADVVLTLNTVSHNYIKDVCGKENIVVSNFISSDFLEELEVEKKINDKCDTFLFVGHLMKEKGCNNIINIAKEFPDKKFIMVGSLSEEISTLEKPSNVIYAGEMKLNEVKQKYREADCFLFPTFTEGFPNVVCEAMSCGMPIITTPVGAIPDMIEDKGGILCPVADEGALYKAIFQIEDKELRKSMSRFNQEKVKNCYTIDTVLPRLFEIYKNGEKQNG